jgi:chemotaxis protein MotB
MPKEKKQTEDVVPNLIMVMTVSLFIILLAFFIMLNSLAVEDESRQRLALGSLMKNFGVQSGGFSFINGNQGVTTKEITRIGKLLDFSDLIKGDEDPLHDLVVTSDRKRSVVTLPAALIFEPGSGQIIPSSYAVLDRIAKAIHETEYSVDIAGYMDKNTEAPGEGFSNRELSALRALAVLRYFIEKGDVSPDLLTAYGWGEFRPLVSDRMREGRVLNQRLEITLARKKRLEKPEGFFTFKNFFFNVFDP